MVPSNVMFTSDGSLITLAGSFDFSGRGADGLEGADATALENLLDEDLALVLEQVPAKQQIPWVSEKR